MFQLKESYFCKFNEQRLRALNQHLADIIYDDAFYEEFDRNELVFKEEICLMSFL